MERYNITLTDGSKFESPRILYKYRDWDDENHRKILHENSIYLASPKSFEDNMDCNLPEVFPKREELKKFFYKKSREINPTFSRQEHRKFADYWSKKSPLAHPNQLALLIDDFNKQFNDRFGVCSLTADPNNDAMWDKYANNHKGICFGFDADKLFSVVGGGGEVIYADTLPEIDFINDDFTKKHVKNTFFKEQKWNFEKEYRLHKFWENTPTQSERNIALPEECLVEVILGKNMSEEYKQEIIQLVRKKYPNVTIK